MGLKKSLKKVASGLVKYNPLNVASGGLLSKGFDNAIDVGRSGAGGPVDFGFQNPQQIAGEETKNIRNTFGLEENRLNDMRYKPTGLGDYLKNDIAFGGNVDFGGPAIEDDSAAYDAALASAQERAALNEKLGTEQVLGGLQGRGIARSGIALKDVVSQVLGPELMRQNELAASFGLKRAERRSDLLEAQRQAQRQARLNQIQNRSGAINDELGREGNFNQGLSNALIDLSGRQTGALTGLSDMRLRSAYGDRDLALQDSINQRRAMEERRRKRKGALVGLAGGALGGYLGGGAGAGAGYQIGSGLGDAL